MKFDKKQKGSYVAEEIRICPHCGMPQTEWKGNSGKGYRQDDKVYCCQSCANETGCDCDTGEE